MYNDPEYLLGAWMLEELQLPPEEKTPNRETDDFVAGVKDMAKFAANFIQTHYDLAEYYREQKECFAATLIDFENCMKSYDENLPDEFKTNVEQLFCVLNMALSQIEVKNPT